MTAVVAAKDMPKRNATVDLSYDLQECIKVALESSPILKREKIDFEQSQLSHEIAKTIYDLQLSLDGDTDTNLSQQDADWRAGFSKTLPRDIKIDGRVSRAYGSSSSMSYALTLSKKLLGGGSKLESMEAIDDSLISTLKAAHDLDDQTRLIKRNVKQAFYRIIRQIYTRDIQVQRLEASKKTLEHAKIREEPIDIANAQVEVPEREIALARAERDLDSGIDNLKIAMGIDQDLELLLNTTFNYESREVEREVFKSAKEVSASILKLRLDLDRQKVKIKIAKERTWPDLNLNFTVDDTRDSGDGSYRFSSPADSKVGLSLDWPLFARSDRFKVDREEYDFKDLELQLFQSEQSLKRTLKDLVGDIFEKERSIELQEQALEVSKLRLNLFKDRWDNGEINILEYIRSQNTYQNKQVEIIQEKTNYMSILAQYDYLLGR